eukprot:scaffold1915_cov143-Skeletonema_menzelii.AAC.2
MGRDWILDLSAACRLAQDARNEKGHLSESLGGLSYAGVPLRGLPVMKEILLMVGAQRPESEHRTSERTHQIRCQQTSACIQREHQ